MDLCGQTTLMIAEVFKFKPCMVLCEKNEKGTCLL